MLGFASEKVPVKETTTPTQAPPGFATLHGGRSSKPIPFRAAAGEKRHVLPAETASRRGSSARQSDKSSWVEKVRAKQALPRAQPAEGKEAAAPRCRAGWSSPRLDCWVLFSSANRLVGTLSSLALTEQLLPSLKTAAKTTARSQPGLLSPPASSHLSLFRSKIAIFFIIFVLSLGVPFAKTLPEQAAKLTGCPEPVGQACCATPCRAGEDSKPAALRQAGERKMVQELPRPPGTRRGMPRYPVCHVGLFVFGFFFLHVL